MSSIPSTFAEEIVLYTRPECTCCEAARATLREHGLTFREIDISQDAELQAQYSVTAPVVVIDGQVRFRGRVNGPLLRRLLKHSHPLAQDQKLV